MFWTLWFSQHLQSLSFSEREQCSGSSSKPKRNIADLSQVSILRDSEYVKGGRNQWRREYDLPVNVGIKGYILGCTQRIVKHQTECKHFIYVEVKDMFLISLHVKKISRDKHQNEMRIVLEQRFLEIPPSLKFTFRFH